VRNTREETWKLHSRKEQWHKGKFCRCSHWRTNRFAHQTIRDTKCHHLLFFDKPLRTSSTVFRKSLRFVSGSSVTPLSGVELKQSFRKMITGSSMALAMTQAY